jgi:hypothetical protein
VRRSLSPELLAKVIRTRTAQGFPPRVLDPAALERAAAALRLADFDGTKVPSPRKRHRSTTDAIKAVRDPIREPASRPSKPHR